MLQTAALNVGGQVVVTVRVNVRQGAPSTTAPVLRKLNPQTKLDVRAIVVGEAVQRNPLWYEIESNAYVWSGACETFVAASRPSPQDQPVSRTDGSIAKAGLEGYGLTEPFASKLAELILACRERGYNFEIRQGLRTPADQARYYCEWQKRTPAHINERVAMLRDAGAPWLADLLASYRDVPRKPAWLTNALPGAGWHQWGEAADCYCFRDGKMVQNGNDPCYAVYADLAERIGLTAGLRFSRPDAGHVQLHKAGSAVHLYSWEYIDAVMRDRFGGKPEIA